jgi:hypothetical protein
MSGQQESTMFMNPEELNKYLIEKGTIVANYLPMEQCTIIENPRESLPQTDSQSLPTQLSDDDYKKFFRGFNKQMSETVTVEVKSEPQQPKKPCWCDDDDENLKKPIVEITSENDQLKTIRDVMLLKTVTDEARSMIVYAKVKDCSDNESDIEALISFLTPSDYHCMRTASAKYPRPLLQFVLGCEDINQSVVDALIANRPEASSPLFLQNMNQQLLFNCVRGHKEAIKKIELMLKEKFDINFKESEHNLNALKTAILCGHSTEFIKFLLSMLNAHKSLIHNDETDVWEQSVCYYALESKLMDTKNDVYVEILDLLVETYKKHNIKLPEKFTQEYFNKKKLMSSKDDLSYSKLEESLVDVDPQVDNFFDECENPLAMVKLCFEKLKKENAILKQQLGK